MNLYLHHVFLSGALSFVSVNSISNIVGVTSRRLFIRLTTSTPRTALTTEDFQHSTVAADQDPYSPGVLDRVQYTFIPELNKSPVFWFGRDWGPPSLDIRSVSEFLRVKQDVIELVKIKYTDRCKMVPWGAMNCITPTVDPLSDVSLNYLLLALSFPVEFSQPNADNVERSDISKRLHAQHFDACTTAIPLIITTPVARYAFLSIDTAMV